MTAVRDPVPLPDEFVLVFEGRTVEHIPLDDDRKGYRFRRCPHCGNFQSAAYGCNMPADTHVCYRDGVKHIVVWKTL